MSCPPGHTLQLTDVMNEYKCRCDDDKNIIDCLTDKGIIIIKVRIHNVHVHYIASICIMYTGRTVGTLY